MNRTTLVAVTVAALCVVACTDDTNVPTRILRRPTSMAVTCVDASGAAVSRSKCGDTGAVATAWVVDADARGLAISTVPGGDHFDADLFEPGFTPLDLGGTPVSVRATDASDLVVVSLAVDDATGKPALAWMAPKDLVAGLALPRAPLPCAPIDVQVAPIVPTGGGDPVLSLLLAYDCDVLVGIAAFPLAARGEATDPRTGERRWPLPARPRAFSVRADGAVAWIALAGTDGDRVARLDLAKDPGDVEAVKTTDLDSPEPVSANPVTGCAEPSSTRVTSRVLGAPVATPDGAFVYVPLARPAGIAVLDDGLARIDVNAPVAGLEGSGNVLLRYLGMRDIPADAPVRTIAMVDLGTTPDATDTTLTLDLGIRAFAAQENGGVSRIVVVPGQVKNDAGQAVIDPINDVPHRAESTPDPVDSVAVMPTTRFGGEVLTRGVVQNSELPSFGSPEIVADPDRAEKYVYYGITFGGDLDSELTETWDVAFEGVIPGASGCGTLETEPGAASAAFFRDPTADFCARGVSGPEGVRPGDVIVITPDPRAACAQAADTVLEYRIASVARDRLSLEPAFVSVPLPPAGCFDLRPLAYEIRASGSWTVVGSLSGFLHGQASDGDACVTRADADPRYVGRALTTLPEDGGPVLQACPVRLGDAKIGANWAASRFANAALSFNVVPGCRTDSKFRPVWLPPERDTRLTFQATSGSTPMSVILGGLPEELVVAGTSIFALDSGTGVVYRVNTVSNTVVDSWY